MGTACQGPGAVEGPGTALKEENLMERGIQHVGSAAALEAAEPLGASVGLWPARLRLWV